MDRQEKLQALANYLGVDTDYFEEEGYDPNEFESKEYNESYLVLTEEEARGYAKRDIENLFDDLGMEAFTLDFQEWIKNNFINTSYFEDVVRTSYENYVDDIESESDDVFENRLIAELVDEEILTEDDFYDWGEDNPTLIPGIDLDAKKRDYVEKRLSEINDFVDYYIDNFGEDDFNAVIKNDINSIDMEEIVEECIRLDGIAHFVARYDGEEIDLGNGLYAYRVD